MGKIKEHKIKSPRKLERTLDELDIDEGIRITGSVKRFKDGGIIFVTQRDGEYYVNISERQYNSTLKGYIPGGKEEWHHFTDSEEVAKYLKGIAKKPLKAWLY